MSQISARSAASRPSAANPAKACDTTSTAPTDTARRVRSIGSIVNTRTAPVPAPTQATANTVAGVDTAISRPATSGPPKSPTCPSRPVTALAAISSDGAWVTVGRTAPMTGRVNVMQVAAIVAPA